jgi:hypothetical protein
MTTKETTMHPDTDLFDTVLDHLGHLPRAQFGIDTDDPWVVIYHNGRFERRDYYKAKLYLEHRDHRHQPDYGLYVFVNQNESSPQTDYAALRCWPTDPGQPSLTYQECQLLLAPLFPNLVFTDEGYCQVKPRPGAIPPWWLDKYLPGDTGTPLRPGYHLGRDMLLSLPNPAKSKALQYYVTHREQHPLPPNWTEECLRRLNHVHLENETYFCDLLLPDDNESLAILWVSQKQDHYPNLTDEDALSLIKQLVDDRVPKIIHEPDPERPNCSSQDRPALQNFSFSYPPNSESSLNIAEEEMPTPQQVAAYCRVPVGPEADKQASLEAQRNTITRIIKRWKRCGLQVGSLTIFTDAGTMPINQNRAVLQFFHNEITEGRVVLVIYPSIEKLLKSSRVYIDLKDFFWQRGAVYMESTDYYIFAVFDKAARQLARMRRST